MAFSFSRLRTYESCPYALKLLQEHGYLGNAATDRGTIVHERIENYIKTGKDRPETELPLERLHEQYQAGQVLLEEAWAFDENWKLVEYTDDNAWVRMKIDFFNRYSGLLIDFKTGKPSPVKHRDQLLLYACGVTAAIPKRNMVYGSNWYIDQNQRTKPWEIKKPMLENYKERLQGRVFNMTMDTELRPRPDPYKCPHCFYQEVCEYGAN